jgi:hypothetical protein
VAFRHSPCATTTIHKNFYHGIAFAGGVEVLQITGACANCGNGRDISPKLGVSCYAFNDEFFHSSGKLNSEDFDRNAIFREIFPSGSHIYIYIIKSIRVAEMLGDASQVANGSQL